MSDEKHFKDAAPDVAASTLALAYDATRDAYWFDHAGRRFFLHCRRASHPEDKGVSIREMSVFADAIHKGDIVVEAAPIVVEVTP